MENIFKRCTKLGGDGSGRSWGRRNKYDQNTLQENLKELIKIDSNKSNKSSSSKTQRN